MSVTFIDGVRRMSRGIRTGNAGIAAVGAALAAWALIRATDEPEHSAIGTIRLKPGEEIRVVVSRGQRTR